MADTTYGAVAASTLRDRLAARIDAVRANLAQWRVYRRTVAELSALSDRDLADLGLHRSMIRDIARQSVAN